MNVRIMYEPAPIRHIAVQCPNCNKWFNGRDIASRRFSTDYELVSTHFTCPMCGAVFGPDADGGYMHLNIEEHHNYREVYEDIYEKAEDWTKSKRN